MSRSMPSWPCRTMNWQQQQLQRRRQLVQQRLVGGLGPLQRPWQLQQQQWQQQGRRPPTALQHLLQLHQLRH